MSLKVKVPVAWFGPGCARPPRGRRLRGRARRLRGSQRGGAPADELLEVDGFLMPGVVDRHVHIRLADPGAVLLGGVTAVRDLAWVPDEIFELASASELPTFTGPVIRAAGPDAHGSRRVPDRVVLGPARDRARARRSRGRRGGRRGARRPGRRRDQGLAELGAGPTPSDAELAAIVRRRTSAGCP